MKKGTHVGLDKNYNNVCVGDHVKDEVGLIYKIDAYGRAVCKVDGAIHELSNLGRFEVYIPDDDLISDRASEEATEEATEEERQEFMRRALEILTDEDLRNEMKKRGLNYTESPEIAECSDADLAAELRARGYDVKATKQVTVEI